MRNKKGIVSKVLVALVLVISASSLFVGCPDPVHNDLPKEPETVRVSYLFPDCEYLSSGYVYQSGSYAEKGIYSTAPKISSYGGVYKKVNKGDKITLLDNGQSEYLETTGTPKNVEYKKECIFSKNLKGIIGWSKKKDGSTKDYDFSEEITVTEDLELYPAYTKYGIGDNIDGKVVVYIRRDYVSTEKVNYTNYSVIGNSWRYITVDKDAGKSSEKRNWGEATSVVTSDDIGKGKENTKNTGLVTYCSTISPNGFVPSKGEMKLIANAIKYRHLDGFAVYSITDPSKQYWTSSQKNTDTAWYLNISPTLDGPELILKSDGKKAEQQYQIIPIIYYDDNEQVVK